MVRGEETGKHETGRRGRGILEEESEERRQCDRGSGTKTCAEQVAGECQGGQAEWMNVKKPD